MEKETLKEAAKNWITKNSGIKSLLTPEFVRESFIAGAKWQQERMYGEEDLLNAFEAGMMFIGEDKGSFKEWFEQFKKK